MLDQERQAIIDDEHLRILSICYLIFGGIEIFFSLFGLLYALLGLFLAKFISSIPPGSHPPPPPEFFAAFIGLIGLGFFTIFFLMAVLKFVVARDLRKRRSRILCMIVAGLSCLGIPFGTGLGVFTLVVLSRPSVEALFRTQKPGNANGEPLAS